MDAKIKNKIPSRHTLSNTHAMAKAHRLVSCLWTSTEYSTRDNQFHVGDGKRRFLEWAAYHKLVGVEHFYLYDNSGASGANSLQSIADLFSDDVTLINWPAKACNNKKDSVGERSSQYAAEASCRIRFGLHTDWIAQVRVHVCGSQAASKQDSLTTPFYLYHISLIFGSNGKFQFYDAFVGPFG
jgi:hypothetical protein